MVKHLATNDAHNKHMVLSYRNEALTRTHLEGIQHGTAAGARGRCCSERLQAHGLEKVKGKEVECLLRG